MIVSIILHLQTLRKKLGNISYKNISIKISVEHLSFAVVKKPKKVFNRVNEFFVFVITK